MWAAIDGIDWACEEIGEVWSISLQAAGPGTVGTRVGRFREDAPRWLAVLEQEHENRFGDILAQGIEDMMSQAAIEAVRRLRDLGARSGGSVGPGRTGGPGQIVVGTVGPGGSTDGSSVNAAAEAAAWANLEKLFRTSADERHLFVWVDATDAANNAAMTNFARPESPNLPDGIDTVWVALWMPNISLQNNAFALWRVTPPAGWEIMQIPAVRSYAIEHC